MRTWSAGTAAHWCYLRAVAEAFEAAGMPVADWRADPGPPRDGWIPFDRSRASIVVWDHDQAGLGWSEIAGWYLLLINSPGRRVTIPLPVPLVAAPPTVIAAVAVRVGPAPSAIRSPGSSGHRDLPDADAGPGTPELERALSRYG
ncbi:DUF6292 family protein [Actinoplanes teichomyceticus]|uniref:DUF6292 domain-containing protein n=1 Tax=Actinoplanes teichomyceticus TaxID=1867 RepID=A0A561VKJ1_ACTTI|nr:DUF6292 family protein [Actinoplanes teichomyceticus]TWG12139.1 hypothetical protein FHX34_1056 [Actinoplanes teichomyceticus]